ncbi:MAG: MarR family winged helix-turn-helix transcriptional regulator [Proteobacteria bacterium]|nr:MarR family winged helix-turn-helix transcriptional regulator [Pseudomonadota bacterium]MDA1356888.1 MarR family winged helix-turn-helix transcriptional regulator [Pseudomonadota bacterium]
MATNSAKVYQELSIPPLRAESRIALESFLPYQLSVIASRVSRGLARLYAVRFDLTVQEWRIMTVLGRFPGVCANEVGELTAMDKVRVSRGVARLLQFERVRRDSDPSDRRRSKLYLSDSGREVYDQIVPVARAYQDKLVADLDSAEMRLLETLLAKIESGVAAIGKEGFGLASGLDTAAHTRGRFNGH